MQSFNRQVWVEINGFEVKGLHVQFAVNQKSWNEPNTAEIKIYNMSASTFSRCSREEATLLLFAGYGDNFSDAKLLFSGELRTAQRSRKGKDIIAEFEGGDGDIVYSGSVCNKSFKKGTPYKEVLKYLASTAGLKLDVVGVDNAKTQDSLTLIGDTSDKLSQLADLLGAEWQVQNGMMQFIQSDTPITYETVISHESGLIGTPRAGKEGDIDILCLLSPSILPSTIVVIDKGDIEVQTPIGDFKNNQVEIGNGRYKVREVKHYGSNFGNSFFTNITKGEVLINGKVQRSKIKKEMRAT